jgi:hypothetical protein
MEGGMEQQRPPRAILANQLAVAAKQAADEVGLQLDASAQDYLGELVSTATEYLVEHPDSSIDQAQDSFKRLAGALADVQRTRTGAAQTLLPHRNTALSADDLHVAALHLCPGFFPFC